MKMKRVMCLYRVSTRGQVDKQDDIPMQRRECKEFISRKDDWVFVGERMEKGISGYKVSAAKRDAIIEIREMAEKKQFDVLLVFMFDRLGRKEDETPFLVKWFIEHGIEVWSTREGEQKLDNQVDRLLNFMRYWAASGESEKTSIRVKAAHTQMTQDGIWRGGPCPYGYKLVHKGRVGKKNRQLYDLAIDEVTGPIVMELFELVSTHGYGTQRAANYLNEKYPDPKKIWTRQTVLTLIRNPIYTGRLHMNDIRSEPIEELRLVSDEEFDFVAKAIEGRIPTRYREIRQAENEAMPDDAPTKTSVYGASLLSGILYCAHCGCKLVGGYCTKQRGGKAYHRPIYRCYNSATKAKGCTGQTVYSAAKIEEAVLIRVNDYFATIRRDVDSAWKENARKRLRDSAKARQKAAEARLVKLQAHQGALKTEIMKAITGESTFDTDLLKEMMEENKQAQAATEQEILDCQNEVEDEEIRIAASATNYKNIQDWAAKFEGAPLDIKKMILARLLEKITVDRDYNIELHFYVTVEDFDGIAASAS